MGKIRGSSPNERSGRDDASLLASHSLPLRTISLRARSQAREELRLWEFGFGTHCADGPIRGIGRQCAMDSVNATASQKGGRISRFLQVYAMFTILASAVAVSVLLINARTATHVMTALAILIGSVVWASIAWGLGVLMEHVIAIRQRLERSGVQSGVHETWSE